MTKNEILLYLESNQNEKVAKMYQTNHDLKVYGVKITDLRNLAKQIKIDVNLSKSLSDEPIYETIFLSILIEDPAHVSLERLEHLARLGQKTAIIDQALADLFLNSNYTIETLNSWHQSDDDNLRYAFYATYQSFLRKRDLPEIDTAFGLKVLDQIKKTLLDEDINIQNAMNNLVVMAGLHVPSLVLKAYEVAEHIGYVLPLKAKNSCNIQSALDYLERYKDNPKYSRVAKLNLS